MFVCLPSLAVQVLSADVVRRVWFSGEASVRRLVLVEAAGVPRAVRVHYPLPLLTQGLIGDGLTTMAALSFMVSIRAGG